VKIENFMQALKEYRSPLVFNPWRDYDPKCDISSDAPVIRAANLTSCVKRRIIYLLRKVLVIRADISREWR
jgi:hypothetical protein